MKYLLLTVFCICSFTSTAGLEKYIYTVYVNGIKVTYISDGNNAGGDTLAVYLNAQSAKPSFEHRISKGKRLQDAAIFDNKLTVIMEDSGTYNVIVFDNTTGTLIDNVRTLFAAMSPDGRFIAYQQWEARYDQSEYGRPIGVAVVYDVTKKAMENRTLAAQKHFKPKAVTLLRVSSNAGVPVYPPGDYNKAEYGRGKTREESAQVYGEYFWYQPNAFIFAVTPKDNFTQIVDAVYNDKQGRFVIKEYKVKTKDFMDGKESTDKYLPITDVDKTGDFIKLKTPHAIIRLNALDQLKSKG